MWRCVLIGLVASCGRIDFDTGVYSRLHVGPLPAETLVDFPLLVVLDDTRAERSLMQPDGSDVRFYATTGEVLADEIEQVGAPGGPPLLAWVRLPSAASSADIVVSYGGDPRATSSDSAWSDAFTAVWHLDGSGDVADSTTNDVTGTATGTTATTGQIGGARAFDVSAPDWITVPGGKDLALPVVTISGWIDPNTVSSTSNYGIVTREFGNGGDNDFWLADGVGSFAVDEYSTAASGDVGSVGTSSIPIGQWTHLTSTVDGANASLYVDGAMSTSNPLIGALIYDQNPIFIGADRNGIAPVGTPDTDFVDGALDEVRIENVTRDAAWISADDSSQRDQLITYGPVEYGPF